MSAAVVDEIVEKASSLSDLEKAAIASRLLGSLLPPSNSVPDEEEKERFRQMVDTLADEFWGEVVRAFRSIQENPERQS